MSERIIDKIRKLAQLEGRTEEEAQLFSQKVQELLEKYKLDMTDIQFEDFKVKEPIQRHLVNWRKHGQKVRSRRIQWIEDLAYFVGEAYQCRILLHSGTSYISFVGRKNDTEVAEYVLVTLVRSAEKIADGAYVKYFYECRDRGEVWKARGFRKAFLDGFVGRIARRLRERQSRWAQAQTALVRFSLKEVDEFIKNSTKGKMAQELSKVRYHKDGYDRGRTAADKIDLDGKAVKQGTARGQIG